MKTFVLACLLALVAGCATSTAENKTAAIKEVSPSLVAPAGTGVWRFSNQHWDGGVHFCEYSQGRNKVLARAELTEICPAEIRG